MVIESKNNEKIKQAVQLAASSKERKQTGLFFLEGLRLCHDAALSGIRIINLFYTADAAQHSRFELITQKAESSYEIRQDIASRLAQTQSSQGVFCVCEKPGMKLTEDDIVSGGCFIALENIQDPANLGAVCRTAEALGIKGAVLSGCCDIYNPKSQRAAMGSLLRLPLLITDDLPGLLSRLKKKGTGVFAAVPDAAAQDIRTVEFGFSSITVIGNEANGVTRETANICLPVTIPMKGRAESLNASAAAAVIMWEIIRRT
ncbi:MAG: RNA methyltransferase [Clostridia bacterium]|nr:RNA methyltransferase [Clostridia bacterium]